MKKLNLFVKEVFKFIIAIIFATVLWNCITNMPKQATYEQFNTAVENNEVISAKITEEAVGNVKVVYSTAHGKYKAFMTGMAGMSDKLAAHDVSVSFGKALTMTDASIIILAIGATSAVAYFSIKKYRQVKTIDRMNRRMEQLIDECPQEVIEDIVKNNLRAAVDSAGMRRGMNGGMNGMNGMGGMPTDTEKSIGKVVQSNITMDDVAGYKEEKQEVLEIIDFIKNPAKYLSIGATIPKGVLLVGAPGTGKTLLAKAIAGEAGINFMYASGSEFVEKFVGVGASRVRDLFAEAKAQAPCILFIDEIDAIGRQRNSNGSNMEHDQTLNQLLVEMDGMDTNGEVLVIAATNRPETLDKAFMRKGRFDRKVTIGLPDTKGREEILRVHAKNKKLSSLVSLHDVAKKTPGFSGADLYALLNEAALMAVRNNRTAISTIDIDEAIDRVMMGNSSRKKFPEKEKEIIAYHECGHVVMGLKLDEASKVDKVTIIPRGDANGYAMLTPKEDHFVQTKKGLEQKICGLLGGRAAEELVFGTANTTTGASNDLERATKIARAMVTEYGMSRLGIMQLEHRESSYAGTSSVYADYSNSKAEEIDTVTQEILDKCYEKALKTLEENRELLDLLADELKEKEVLNSRRIKAISKEVL